MVLPEKRCAVCGEKFGRRYPNQKYCGIECKVKARVEREEVKSWR